ncbi:MAG: hypothetical protein OQK25_04825 [Gammaproteobacteria bacterium]|nr:hypothetical protein [Gammaproteobacteria bacterium]
MTQTIPDFNKNELWIINTTLEERYGEKIELEFADSEMRLNPHSTEMTPCPTIFWANGDASFVIVKVDESRYRTQFFYRVHQQFGTGVEIYDDLTDCVVSILQVQADYMAKVAEAEAKAAEKAAAK